MSLISIDPSNLLTILVTTVLTQPRTPTGRVSEGWWNVIPWALIYALFVLIFVIRVTNAVHRSHAPSDPLARQSELLDTVGVAVTILVLTWGFFDRFWRSSAIQRQRNPANGDDVELQILGGRDDAPQPHPEHVELRVRDEEGLFEGEMDIEAGGELRNMVGVDDFVVNMPGAFPA